MQLTILDNAPTEGVNRIEFTNCSSTDADIHRVAFGSEDLIIDLPDGEIDGGMPVNGIHEIYFAVDDVTLNDATITTMLNASDGSSMI